MNRFIVADVANCIGCHACEVACVTAHHQDAPAQRSAFVPRIHVVFHRNTSTATTCHHCNDAPCVTSCPTQALYVANDSIQFTRRVYRLQNCVVACPFGAIEMVASGKMARSWRKMRSLSRSSLRRAGLRGQLPDSGAARNGRERPEAVAAGKTNPLRRGSRWPSVVAQGAKRYWIKRRGWGRRSLPRRTEKGILPRSHQRLSECDAEYESERCLYCAQKPVQLDLPVTQPYS